ncbi:uncharacterized protein ACIBXB_002521 [Morphnus guianensis]
MEDSEGGGGGEELNPQPQPSQEDEHGPSARDEGHSEPGMHPTASDSRNSVPEGREDVGSAPEQATGEHASDCDNSWEIVCGEPELAPADPLAGDGDDGGGQATESLSEHKDPPRDEIRVQQILARHHAPVEENYQNAGVPPKGASEMQEQKHLGSPAKVPADVKRAEMTNEGNLNRAAADRQGIGEGPGPSRRAGGDNAGDAAPPGTSAKSQPRWICQPSPYLFGRCHPTQDMMTLEFVAVLSDCHLDERFKICVVFYKQPRLCEEFAKMEKREKVITGSARIPLSRLQGGLIFYKYALVNTYSSERECELEQISLENSDIPETFKYRNSQLFRVMNIPKTEIKADGTWTFFEHLECNFPSSSTGIWKVLSKKVPRCKIQMEYLTHNFFAHATSWNSLEDTERKLDRYKESVKARLGDAEKGECFEIIHNSDAEAVKDGIKSFAQAIIKSLKTMEHKLPKLLFAFHVSFRYDVALPAASIAKAEKCFEAIKYVNSRYEELRGKSKYFPALKEMCLRTTDGTLWIWLVPLLYAIKAKTEDPFRPYEPPSSAFIQLRGDKEKQREVLKMIDAHETLIRRCAPLAKKVLEMVAVSNFTRDPLPDISFPLQLLLETLYVRILDSQVPEEGLNVALESIATRMDVWFKALHPSGSSKPSLKPTHEEEVLQCLNLVYILLRHVLERLVKPVSFSSVMIMLRMLGMFAGKADLLRANKEFQQFTSAERFREFSRWTAPWLERHFHKAPVDEKTFLNNIEASDEAPRPIRTATLGRPPRGSADGFGFSSVGLAAAAFAEDPLRAMDRGVAELDPRHV